VSAAQYLASACTRLRPSFRQRLLGAGTSLQDIARSVWDALVQMHAADDTHSWWQRAGTLAAPGPASGLAARGPGEAMLAFDAWEGALCTQLHRGAAACGSKGCGTGAGAGATVGAEGHAAQGSAAAAANFVVVHNTLFVLSRASDLPELLDALEQEGRHSAALEYAKAQGAVALAGTGASGAAPLCLGSIIGFKLIGNDSRAPALPASCILSHLCTAAEHAGVGHALHALPLWCQRVAADRSNYAQASATAEAIAGLCQIVQQSFPLNKRGYGAHKQLGARQGSRARNF